ncbi:fatty acid cis/trans isomerase [Marinimicrobium sp. ARAG 43.8]|uniref:fatty acid cis/trans isomerase n=1 Tax=Marinimicrobium sp. ARAG 43.8 TaxID=3418719 RepID=UPI003CF95B15
MPARRWFTHSTLVPALMVIIGCSAISHTIWNKKYGEPEPRETNTAPMARDRFQSDIKPLLEQRCTVCHGCYDAACQLKMESWEGLLRGASNDRVYDGTRLLGAEMTRLYEDAHTTAEWRKKGFFPVINEREPSPENNLTGSVMAQMLLLKQRHPLPAQRILSDDFDFSLSQRWQCPSAEEFEGYAESNPLAGMPYGLPGLSDKEHDTLIHWLRDGAPGGGPAPMGKDLSQQVTQWERFLNGDSLKERLMSRYLYEHLFLAHLHFQAKNESSVYFKLVRSSTPPGEPLQRISTRRPFDDPGVDRIYYRLWRDPSSIVVKNHLPYALTTERRQRWQRWFLDADYTVDALPGYEPEQAANPFATFVDLPADARYRFLLDEAEFTIMNFIKGPVCRGQVALNVIQDHFWVAFVDPAYSDDLDSEFLANNSDHLKLPAGVGNTLMPLSNWHRYSELQKDYLSAKATFIGEKLNDRAPLNLDIIWDGIGPEGKNRNAALTVFRHTDSASVHKGFIGQPPKTAWVIDYPLLERIHYLLVAGFDVYGNTSHQLLSRLYMDFLRMEGEMNFVTLLPDDVQEDTLMSWYRNAESDLQEYLDVYRDNLHTENAIDYPEGVEPQAALYSLLKEHLDPVLSHHNDPGTLPLVDSAREALASLNNTHPEALRHLPPVTLVYMPEQALFTLVHNNAYSNLSSLFDEEDRRRPDEDTLTIARGVVGSYPNSFLMVDEAQVPEFVRSLQSMKSESDYQALKDRFGIRRSDPNFWQISDDIHALYRTRDGHDAGLLDYNRLENR